MSGFLPRPKVGKSNLFLKIISFLPRVLHRDKTRWAFKNSREMYKIRGAFLECSQRFGVFYFRLLNLLYHIDFTRARQNTHFLCFMH